MNLNADDPMAAVPPAIERLLQQCRKGGPLYQQHPQAVSKVNRTARWLLHAIARLHRERVAQDTSS